MEHFDHVIIGAGISGLGMAHFSRHQGLQTLILERSERAGGSIRSHGFPETQGFWAELGAHTCYNSYGQLLSILDEVGLSGALAAKQKLRYSMQIGTETRSIVSRLHPFELIAHLPRLLFASKDGQSVETYYSGVLGPRNYRDLFAHAFDAVICQPAAQFPAELLFRKKPRRKEVMRSFTLPGGIEDLARSLVQQPGLEVRLACRVRPLRRVNGELIVAVEDRGDIRARYVTLAVPPDQALGLLPPGFEGAAAALAQIGMSEIDSIAVCVPAAAVNLPPMAGLIGVEQPFLSVVSRDYIADANYRAFTFHFRQTASNPAEHLERIAQVLGVPRQGFSAFARAQNRLPALRAGHSARVREIDAALAGTPLALTGNYFRGLSLEDCLIRSAAEMARLLGT